MTFISFGCLLCLFFNSSKLVVPISITVFGEASLVPLDCCECEKITPENFKFPYILSNPKVLDLQY